MQEYQYTNNGERIIDWLPVGAGCGKPLSACLAEAEAKGLSWDAESLPKDAALMTVERMAFRRALFAEFGLKFSDIRQVIESIPDSEAKELALIEFEEATVIRRDNALLEQIRLSLGKTTEQTDELFRKAV